MTPIFVISFNRLTVLRLALTSYEQLPGTQIIIHDTGSTYEPLLAYLSELQQSGKATICHGPPVLCGDDLNSVAATIERWFSENDADHYIVTDPDVALCDDCHDLLELYADLLRGFPTAEVVGPMLRIDDIPDHYPVKEFATQRHVEQFWHKTPLSLDWNGKVIQYQKAPIDTTFGMYRMDFKFHRLSSGLRTYAPYWARHLDWYIDPERMEPDQKFYLQTSSDVSHWGGAYLREKLTMRP